MELTELKDRIVATFSGTESDLADVLAMIEQDQSVFPFNEYEHRLYDIQFSKLIVIEVIKVFAKYYLSLLSVVIIIIKSKTKIPHMQIGMPI